MESIDKGIGTILMKCINITQSKTILETAIAVTIASVEEIFCLLTQAMQFTRAMKPLAKFPRTNCIITRMEKTVDSRVIMSRKKKPSLISL